MRSSSFALFPSALENPRDALQHSVGPTAIWNHLRIESHAAVHVRLVAGRPDGVEALHTHPFTGRVSRLPVGVRAPARSLPHLERIELVRYVTGAPTRASAVSGSCWEPKIKGERFGAFPFGLSFHRFAAISPHHRQKTSVQTTTPQDCRDR